MTWVEVALLASAIAAIGAWLLPPAVARAILLVALLAVMLLVFLFGTELARDLF